MVPPPALGIQQALAGLCPGPQSGPAAHWLSVGSAGAPTPADVGITVAAAAQSCRTEACEGLLRAHDTHTLFVR